MYVMKHEWAWVDKSLGWDTNFITVTNLWFMRTILCNSVTFLCTRYFKTNFFLLNIRSLVNTRLCVLHVLTFFRNLLFINVNWKTKKKVWIYYYIGHTYVFRTVILYILSIYIYMYGLYGCIIRVYTVTKRVTCVEIKQYINMYCLTDLLIWRSSRFQVCIFLTTDIN